MKIGCENTVVRMVSSGNFVSQVSFSYRLLDNQELQTIKLNNVEDFCFNNWSHQDQRLHLTTDISNRVTDPLTRCQIQRCWCKMKTKIHPVRQGCSRRSCLSPQLDLLLLPCIIYLPVWRQSCCFYFCLNKICLYWLFLLLFMSFGILEEDWC